MKIKEGISREAIEMVCLDARISEEDEVRLIDRIVEEIDIKKLGYEEKKRKTNAGRPQYGPKALIKLLIQGYRLGLHSGKKLENACRYDIRFQWLMEGLEPDKNTINDFRKDNIKLLRNIFYEINRIYIELEILKIRNVSQDGFKIKAVNSKEKNYTKNKIIDRIKRESKKIEEKEEIKKKIEEENKKADKYLETLEKSEELEKIEEEIKERKEELEKTKKEIEEIRKRKEKHEKMLKEMGKEKSQISITDPDSKLMKNNDKFEVAYNNQSLVDMESHITVAYKTDNNPADIGSMSEIGQIVREEYKELEIITNTTDKGYNSIKDMATSLEMGIVPQVTPTKELKEVIIETEYEANEISEEELKSKKAKDIKKCLRSGVIPECYVDNIKEIEIIEKKEEIKQENKEKEEKTSEELREEALEKQIFIRDEEIDVVYCPVGEALGRKSQNKKGKRYANKLACKRCKNPCTKSKFKTVDFKEGQKIVKPSNNSMLITREIIKRKKKTVKKVRIKLKLDEELLKKRMQTSEHTQGTMKTADNFRSFSMRGKEKVSGEMAIHLTSSNIRRVSNMIGVQEMIRRLNERCIDNKIDEKINKNCKIKIEFAIFFNCQKNVKFLKK